jgi:tetratricopeptide (TPR) repeat protein
MKIKDEPRFDLDALRSMAGAKSFANGEAYCRDGQVQILVIEPQRVLAQVAGTEDYRTELRGRGKKIGGECSCPAFEEWGFCKHMVATALAANALGADAEADGEGALSRIRRHLKEKGVDALVEMIVGLAERDPTLFRKLDVAAASTDVDDKTLEARLRKAIDGATRVRGYVDYREASDWAAEVDATLDVVADLASGARAGLAMKLAERAMDRIERAIEEVDDSDGDVGGLLHRARDIHLAAATSMRPEPVSFAHDLFAREMDDEYGAFEDAAEIYTDALGEEGLAEYRRLALEAWDKLPALSGRDPQCATEVDVDSDASGGYRRLKDILDFFLERDGDVDARIALRAKDLSSPWSYLQLAEFCAEQGREGEALRWAEEGMWIFEDGRPDERLVLFAVGLLSKAGRKADAEAHLRRVFEKAPSLQLYTSLRELGGEAAGERAVKFLEDRLVGEKPAQWHRLADLLIRILMQEEMFEAAWATSRKHGASPGLKDALAQASEATHGAEAIAVYAERVEGLVGAGGNPGYAEAVKLVVRMASLRDAAEQTAYVAALKTRFGAKRNFMKLLG